MIFLVGIVGAAFTSPYSQHDQASSSHIVKISTWTCERSSSYSLYQVAHFHHSTSSNIYFTDLTLPSSLSTPAEVELQCTVPCSQENNSHLHLLPQQTWQPPTSSTQSCPPTLESDELSSTDLLPDVSLPYQYPSIDALTSPLSNAQSSSATLLGRLSLAHPAHDLEKRRRSMCIIRIF